jgi:PleD family two-component response regulator
VTEAQTAPDALVAAADAALYLAKAAGRNRLVQATENSLVTPVDANGDTQT